jgi:hypothetical protein
VLVARTHRTAAEDEEIREMEPVPA